MSFEELELDLGHEAMGGHDVYQLGYAGGSVLFCIDFGHEYRRSACFVAEDVELARTFAQTVARDAGVDLTVGEQPRDSVGRVDVLLVGEVEDENGDTWKTIRVTFEPAVELEFRLGVSRKTCLVTPRMGSAESAFTAWANCLFQNDEPIVEVLETLPDWVDPHPLASGAQALPERFTSRVIWVDDAFVGVAEDPGLVFAHSDHGLEIVFETRHVTALAGYGKSVVVAHEDEQSRGMVSIIRDINETELEIDDLYTEPIPLPSEALLIAPDGTMVAFAVPGRHDARFATLIVDTDGKEIDCIEDGWPISWDTSGLCLRGVDGGGALVWDGPLSVSAGDPAARFVGPWMLRVEDGLVRLNEHAFATDGAPKARVEGRSYQPLDAWCVFNWKRPYLVDVRQGRGWPLLPTHMAAQHVVVDRDRTKALLTIQGVSFVATLRGPNDHPTPQDHLEKAFAQDQFVFQGVSTDLSLAELGRWHGLSPAEVKKRLTQSATSFVETRMKLARDAINTHAEEITAIGVDNAAGWVVLSRRFAPDEWLERFEHALAQTFTRRLTDEKFMEFALHGGVIPGEDVSRVQEALVGAKRAWLDPPQSEMQERVALAIDVAVEVLVDFRTSPVPSNVWETVENHMARVHELLALGVPEVVGLGETIELLRSIETMATR